jgi:transcriptional regulator
MPQPVKVEEIPEKSYNENFRGIVGFKIYIDEIQAAYKLSQNRDEESYHHVIRELEKGDDVTKGVAEEMKKKTNFE